jgi:hypothetical protein
MESDETKRMYGLSLHNQITFETDIDPQRRRSLIGHQQDLTHSRHDFPTAAADGLRRFPDKRGIRISASAALPHNNT